MKARSQAAGQERRKVRLTFHTVTKDRWKDFERLFGDKGACGGCWCMWWRLAKRQFEAQKGAQNKKAMKAIIDSGEIPGLLAYADREPVAWCSVAPRDVFPRLDSARTLKRIDDRPVWSVVCFYIAPGYRRAGVSGQLLEAAVAHVKKHGGTIVEGYPFEIKKGAKPLPGAFVYAGLVPAFKKAGFKVALRRSASRPIMRYYIEK